MDNNLSNTLLSLAADTPRLIVAIAGPPASGKTTLCDSLLDQLNASVPTSIVAMDGFHLDNPILEDLNLLDRKGSPPTFDVAGLNLLLQALKTQTDTLTAPAFDRALDLSKNCARLIQPDDKIILVEGNYLLCNTHPWQQLHQHFDFTVSLNVEESVLEKRLIDRWLTHDHSAAQAHQRAHHNDIPNAKYVLQHSISGNIVLSN